MYMKSINWILTDLIIGGHKNNGKRAYHWAKKNQAYIKKQRKNYGYFKISREDA